MRWKTIAATLGMLTILILSACGSTASGSSGGSQQSSALITTRTVTVAGASTTVLTTGQGMTLYSFASDTSTQVACTGTCAQNWPPLLVSSGSAPTSDVSLPGNLSTLNGANGQQVMYNGHPLYTFSGDKNPGDTTGEGIKGLWHVATPNLAPAGPAPAPTSTYIPSY